MQAEMVRRIVGRTVLCKAYLANTFGTHKHLHYTSIVPAQWHIVRTSLHTAPTHHFEALHMKPLQSA